MATIAKLRWPALFVAIIAGGLLVLFHWKPGDQAQRPFPDRSQIDKRDVGKAAGDNPVKAQSPPPSHRNEGNKEKDLSEEEWKIYFAEQRRRIEAAFESGNDEEFERTIADLRRVAPDKYMPEVEVYTDALEEKQYDREMKNEAEERFKRKDARLHGMLSNPGMAIDILRNASEDYDEDISSASLALMRLIRYGKISDDIASQLLDVFKSARNDKSRRIALWTLLYARRDDPVVIETFKNALANSDNVIFKVDHEIWDRLADDERYSENIRTRMIDIFKSSSDGKARAQSIRILLRAGKNDPVVRELLIVAAQDASWKVRAMAAGALKKDDRELTLRKQLAANDPDWSVRQSAVASLLVNAPHERSFLREIFLAEKHELVKQVAMRELARDMDRETFDLFLSTLKRDDDGRLNAMIFRETRDWIEKSPEVDRDTRLTYARELLALIDTMPSNERERYSRDDLVRHISAHDPDERLRQEVAGFAGGIKERLEREEEFVRRIRQWEAENGAESAKGLLRQVKNDLERTFPHAREKIKQYREKFGADEKTLEAERHLELLRQYIDRVFKGL